MDRVSLRPGGGKSGVSSVWTKDAEMLLQRHCGEKVRIILEKVTGETSE